MAVISQGIKLSYKTSGANSYTDLTNLQEIPELGGSADSIEITTLADTAHVYTNGIMNYGDNIAFKFLYEKAQFTTLAGLSGAISWKVTLPGTNAGTASFDGSASVALDGVGVNGALTYTLNIKPSSAITWA